MASYRMRPDGLIEVQQDDGSVSPGLPPSIQGSLEAEGIMPAPPSELGLGQSGATAGLDYMNEWSSPDAPLAPTTPAPVAPPRPQQQRPKARYDVAGALQDPTPEQQADLVPPDQVVWSDEPAQKNLVGAGTVAAGNAPDPRAQVANEVMAEMQRGTRRVAPRPERDVLVGYTEQGRAPLPEEQMQARRENLDAQTAEVRKQGDLVAEKLDREQFADEVERREQRRQLDLERELNERREAAAARLKIEADQAQRDIQSVNPQAYWDEMGGGARLGAILAVAMSGFAAGFTGSGRNTALEMLQQAVQDNIDAQKTKIAQQEDRYSESRAAYERALEAAGGDEHAADLIYSAGLSRLFAEQTRAYAADVNSDIMKSTAEQTALQMEEAAAEKEAELMGLNRVRAAQFAHQEARAGGVIRPTYEQALERVGKRHELEQKAGLRDAPADREDLARRVVLKDGTAVYAKDQQTASTAQTTMDALERYRRLANDAKELLSQSGHSVPFTERKSRLSAIGTEMSLQVRTLNELGVISDSDVENFMKPLSAMGSEEVMNHAGGTITKLDEVVRMNQVKESQYLRQMARDPGMQQPVAPQDRLMQGGGVRRGF